MIEVHSGTFVFMFINFLILMLILVFLLYRPIQGILQKRAQKISDDLDQAQKSRERWEKMQLEAKTALDKAGAQAVEIIERARNEAEKAREEILAKARQEAEDIRQRSLAEIERAKRIAAVELREGVVTLALTAVGKVLGAKMSPDINEALINNTLASIEKEAGQNAGASGGA
ncbi:MAG: F0F1 ATP synthase subunit B [Firmicutes bacterium]|nr:F0F1 ATP synthase subunit B [Bacillota bacterium]